MCRKFSGKHPYKCAIPSWNRKLVSLWSYKHLCYKNIWVNAFSYSLFHCKINLDEAIRSCSINNSSWSRHIPLTNYKTTQKMKFSIEDFFSKSDEIRVFTKEILNWKLHFCVLCNIWWKFYTILIFVSGFMTDFVDLLGFTCSIGDLTRKPKINLKNSFGL